MKTLAILLCFVTGMALGSEMDDLVVQLGNDDFEIREKATAKLSDYPEEFVKKFLDMAQKENDPEIRYRLHVVAKHVFIRKVVSQSDDWLFLHGTLGIEITRQNICKIEIDPNTNVRQWVNYETVFIIDFCKDEIVGDNIKQWDRIMSIEDVTLDQIKVKPGKEYKITLRRYKNVEKIQNAQMDLEDKEYEEKEVKIKAVEKEAKFVDPADEFRISETQWLAYYEGYKNAQIPKGQDH